MIKKLKEKKEQRLLMSATWNDEIVRIEFNIMPMSLQTFLQRLVRTYASSSKDHQVVSCQSKSKESQILIRPLTSLD